MTAVSMVLAEIVAMGVVEYLRPSLYLATTLIDAFVMITLGFPALYALSFRPLMRLADSRRLLCAKLEETNSELQAAIAAERDARASAEMIRSAAIAITRSVDIDTVLAALLDRLELLIPFDRARVMLFQKESLLALRVVRCGGKTELLPAGSTAFDPAANPVLRQILASGEGMVIADTHAHPDWGPHMRPDFERSWMGVPLMAGGKLIGLYSLSKGEAGAFLEEQRRLAEALSAPASVAIQNALLFEELRAGQARLKALSRRLVDLQENERRSIARELHDEAGQTLTSLQIGLRLLEQASNDPALASRVAQLRRSAEGVQESLHQLAANLRPPSLDHLGLVPALGQLAENLSGSSGVNVEVEAASLSSVRLPTRVETDLYRIAQEAVTNAVRHASAREIGVLLEHRGGRVRLMVEDDGCGFDPSVAERSGRLGLLGIRERAEALGGTLLVESGAGAGTTVVVEAPDGY